MKRTAAASAVPSSAGTPAATRAPRAPGRRIAAALLALALLAGSGTATAQSAIMFAWGFGRFSEVEKLAEAAIRTPADRNVKNLVPLCVAYLRVKRYNKLTNCIELLDAGVAAGDRRHSDFMMFPSDITALPDMLRAAVAMDFGDFAAALRHGQSSLSKVNPDGGSAGLFPPHAYPIELLPHMAVAAAALGQRERAEGYTKALLEISVPYVGSAMFRNQKEIGLARAYMALGQYERALEHLREEHMRLGTAIADLLMGSGKNSFRHLADVPRQVMIARCLVETGKPEEAVKVLDTLLANPRTADQGDIHWLAMAERARLAERAGDAGQALDLYRRSIEVIEQQRASIGTEASKIGFVGDKQRVYGQAIALMVSSGRAGDAFDLVERAKARALVDLLASRRDFAPPRADDPDSRRILDRLASADMEARLQDESAQPGDNPGQRNLAVAQREIRELAPELSSLVTVTSVPSSELRALVGAGEALVEYYYREDALYAFVLTRDALSVATLDGKGLVESVQAMREAVEAATGQAWRGPARALYDRLVRPLEPLLGERSLVLVPHGALHYLPFAALARDAEALLIDRHSLRMLPSASVLKYLRPPLATREAGMLALGNPDLGDPKMDLAFAEGEARALAGLAPNSRLLVRRDTSETNFKQAGRLFSRIHFATHGKFNADNPLESGLYLAKDEGNDGVLTVGELYGMSMDADLVTLSACETGLGKVNLGDDVVGLARGFLYAGARSIVASLWSVDDKATSELMLAFYGNLAAKSKQEALRQAQLQTRATFAHPFFWAAFQLTGRGD